MLEKVFCIGYAKTFIKSTYSIFTEAYFSYRSCVEKKLNKIKKLPIVPVASGVYLLLLSLGLKCMHSFRCSHFVPNSAQCEKKNDKNSTKLSQMVMRFKSENISNTW